MRTSLERKKGAELVSQASGGGPRYSGTLRPKADVGKTKSIRREGQRGLRQNNESNEELMLV